MYYKYKFKLLIYLGQEGDWKKTETVYLSGKDNRAYVDVRGLNKTIEYEFVTVAVNSAGESDRSDSNSTYPGESINRKCHGL